MRVHIPDESERVIPPKTKEVKEKKEKKERKRKRDSSSHAESATKKTSVDTIRTAVPLQVRSAEGEVSTLLVRVAAVSSKGKEKVGELAAAPSRTLERFIVVKRFYLSDMISILPTWDIRV